MSRKRYHHINFEEDEEFQTPAFEFLNESEGRKLSPHHAGSDDDFALEDSENDDFEGDGGNSDDDDAPEDVSFKTGRQTALQQMKDAIKQISGGKMKAKEERRKIDEQFKEKKKRKMEELKNARLPADFLDDLTDNLPIREKKVKTTEKKSDLVERNSLQDDEDEGSFADTEDDFDPTQDFIPLKSDRFGGVDVQPIKEYEKRTISAALTAAEFKCRHLYVWQQNTKRINKGKTWEKDEKDGQQIKLCLMKYQKYSKGLQLQI